MSHFAQVEDGVVVQVIVADNEEWCVENLGGKWVQTSYSTYEGVHERGGRPFRYNFASIGFTYDEDNDAFIAPKPFESWILDTNTFSWKPPVEEHTDRIVYWDEPAQEWKEVTE